MSNTIFVMVAYSAVTAFIDAPLGVGDMIMWGMIVICALVYDIANIITKNKKR